MAQSIAQLLSVMTLVAWNLQHYLNLGMNFKLFFDSNLSKLTVVVIPSKNCFIDFGLNVSGDIREVC